MSYILDALRRAERERNRDAVDPVSEITAAAPSVAAPQQRRRSVLIAGAVIIALLLIANLVLLLVHRSSIPVRPTAVRTAALEPVKARPQAAVPTPRAMPTPATAQSVPLAAAASTPITSATQLIPAGASTAAAPANPVIAAASIHSLDQITAPPVPATQHGAASSAHPHPTRPVATRHPRPSHRTTAASSRTPTVASASAPSATAAAVLQSIPPPAVSGGVGAAQPQPSATDLKMMPDQYRANFPQITVQVHVYDPDPDKCWVMIDGRRYRQGDTLPQGPKIEQIVPQGIVFDWHGREVLYPT
ncbi:MAG TPA: general secretion pathway protein GspB [Nevskiaceae bacterium]|nr:general secretion pathway protein GspB [Nevskiaceae bacterium]